MNDRLTLMFVHAHPDDEAFGSAGTLTRYSAEGAQTCLVVSTRGEVGEIHDPDLDEAEARPRLGQIREEELRRAVEILGVTHLDFLGYEDSGMVGTPENTNLRCFHQSSLDEAAGRLVALIRRYRPQVVVSYGEDGGYNHPDHVRTHLVTACAFQDAGNPLRFPEAGEAWQPQKLYGTGFSRKAMRSLWDAMRERGVRWPFGEDGDEEPPNWGSPDERLTATIDVSAYVPKTRQALRQHRTQFDPDGPWMNLADDLAVLAFGREYFVLLRSILPTPVPDQEDDLFTGVRPT
ncbi:MAG: PIG-L family deacetylase [Dehalococcoidia bacterium]